MVVGFRMLFPGVVGWNGGCFVALGNAFFLLGAA